MRGPAFCTIIAKNYLAQARALSRSLRRCHRDLPLYVLVVDGLEDLAFKDQDESFRVVHLASLDLPDSRELSFRYDLVEFCTAVKPFLLRSLFELGHSKVIFLDPDVWVFRPLTELLQILDSSDIVLTPHLTARVDDGKYPGEPLIRLVGAYNLGFLALSRTSNVDELLKWWSARLERLCLVDFPNGLFLEQKWMNLVPGMFDRVLILRHPGYNVAHWNVAQRSIEGPAESPFVGGQPLYFFHFSGINPLRPQELKFLQDRYKTIESEPLATMLHRYSAELLEGGYEVCSRWPYAYDAFDDGQLVTPELRRLFREQPPGRFPNPFLPERADSFLRWAITPGTPGPNRSTGPVREMPTYRSKVQFAFPVVRARSVMPGLVRIWESNERLQERFPMAFVEEHDAPDFLAWIDDHQAQLNLDHGDLTSIRRLLTSKPGLRIGDWHRKRRDLQRAFPGALAWPGDPNFISWLESEGRAELGLDDDSILWFKHRSKQHVCPRIHELFSHRSDWQRDFPLGLSPLGQEAFLARLREMGTGLGMDVSTLRAICPVVTVHPLAELRLLYETDSNIRERFPRAFRERSGTEELVNWVRRDAAQRFGSDTEWFSLLAKELSEMGPLGEAVVVLGHINSESGLGELARATTRALRAVGHPCGARSIAPDVHRQMDLSVREHPDAARYPIAVVTLTAWDSLLHRDRIRGALEESYAIGYWPWELEVFPSETDEAFLLFDEIWALSRFSATAISARCPIPVVPVWPAVLEPAAPPRRDDRLLPAEDFMFLFVFDFLSEMERKNPTGLISAFRKAFRGDDHVGLVIKTLNGDMRKSQLKRLQAAAGDGVFIHDRYLDRPDLLGLLHSCDCYVSLHRAEGFGFTLAEAMGLRKPVIATSYSANMEYMTPWNSFLVPYQMAEIREDHGLYRKGQLWAEPDLEAAASILRRVYTERQHSDQVASRAQSDVRQLLSLNACGERMTQRLQTIFARVPTPSPRVTRQNVESP